MARRKIKLAIAHATLGPGAVLYKLMTDSGAALRIEFADRRRTLLVEGTVWATGVDAAAVYAKAPEAPQPKAPPKKAVKVRSANDVGQELGELEVAAVD